MILDPLFPPKVVEEPTDYHKKLASIYNAMCSKLNIVPVSHIERKLSDATINIRSRGIGPKGVKAIAVALVVREINCIHTSFYCLLLIY